MTFPCSWNDLYFVPVTLVVGLLTKNSLWFSSCFNNTQRLKTGSNVHPPTCEIHLTSIADQVLRKLTFFRNNNKVTLQEIKDNSLISDFHFPSFCFLFRRALQSTMREMHEEKSNSVNETSGLLRCFWKAHLTNSFESGFRMSIH